MAQSTTNQWDASRIHPFQSFQFKSGQLQSGSPTNVQSLSAGNNTPMLRSYADSAPGTDSFQGGGLFPADSGYAYPFSGGAYNDGTTQYSSTYSFNDPYGQYTGADPVYQPPLDNNTVIARIQSVSGDIDGLSDGAKDGKISAADLRAVINSDDPKFDAGIKASAQYLLDNESGLRGHLDGVDGQADGFFTTDSLNKLMVDPNYTPPQMTNTQALIKVHDELFNRAKAQLGNIPFISPDDLAGDAQVNRQSILALANDPNASPDVKEAAQHILDNPALMDKLARVDENDSNTDFSINEFNRVINTSNVDSIGNTSPYIY